MGRLMGLTEGEIKLMERARSVKLTIEPGPRKFQPGDRVKPTPTGIKVLWTKPGIVVDCGSYAVAVRMDGESVNGWYSQDFWELE
jgi:hypothetical protein